MVEDNMALPHMFATYRITYVARTEVLEKVYDQLSKDSYVEKKPTFVEVSNLDIHSVRETLKTEFR